MGDLQVPRGSGTVSEASAGGKESSLGIRRICRSVKLWNGLGREKQPGGAEDEREYGGHGPSNQNPVSRWRMAGRKVTKNETDKKERTL